MPRTKGATGIKGWVEHELLRALALGEESVEELAEKFDLPPNTIHHFNLRNKHRIAAVLANWSDEFGPVGGQKACSHRGFDLFG
jgi:hypothetical protein